MVCLFLDLQGLLVDPLLTGLMNQQLQLGQAMMEVLRRQQQQQPQQQAQQQQPQVGVQDRERLTMDTKWIPASPCHLTSSG